MRRSLVSLALLGCGVVLTLACATAAAPASRTATRTVVVSLSGSGSALWTTNTSDETSTQKLTYTWRGTLKFEVAASKLDDPQHMKLSVQSAAVTLVANWAGTFSGTKTSAPYTGDIACEYKGTNVKTSVRGILKEGTARGTLELTLHPSGRSNFFPNTGAGATASCRSDYGSEGPKHFEPEWLFRDSLQDHGYLSQNTAIVILPAALLPRGSATVTFPKEKGQNNSVGIGHLTWKNAGKLVVRAR